MALPVRRREKDAFLSHAHVDKSFADQLHFWLTEKAGFNIWYDSTEMIAGTSIIKGLNQGIEKSRGLILLGTEEAFNRQWVQKELAAAHVEDADAEDFRIIPIVVGDAKPGVELKGLSWIHLPKPEVTFDLAIALLRAFHPSNKKPDPRGSKDVYISASWHADDCTSAKTICRKLIAEGFRLIGDDRDQKGFGKDRIEHIISSCGALVCIIPYRGATDANLTSDAYKYFLREIDIARRLGLACFVFADPRVVRTDAPHEWWHRVETKCSDLQPDILAVLEDVYYKWREPAAPHRIFFAVDFDFGFSTASSPLRRMVESTTGMETVIGSELKGNYVQDEIMNAINKSFLVIADISGEDDNSFNLDVAIEAGVARAFGRNLVLITRGKSRRPPFMLRASGQLEVYENDIEMMGVYRKLVWPYRRRIINAEL